MTKEQVQELRNAGISESAIIDRILEEMGTPDPGNPDAGDPEKKPEPEKKQDPEPEKKPEPEKERPDRTDEVIAAIQKLTGAVLGHNVNGTGSDDSGKTGDDIIGELLRGEPVSKK